MARFETWPPSPEDRPLPLRSYSETGPGESPPSSVNGSNHMRRKSTRPTLEPPTSRTADHQHQNSLPSLPEVREIDLNARKQPARPASLLLTPPITPQKSDSINMTSPTLAGEDDILSFDFSKIDYELDRARAIGKGLWSSVHLAQPVVKSPTQSPKQTRQNPPTPPGSPGLRTDLLPCSVFAVKVAARPDAKEVFRLEGRSLTTLQQSSNAHEHIVQFLGLDRRDGSLVFEGVLGGSLESLTRRLKVMTELERHLELRSLFPKIANDLVNGLAFIHGAGMVHADIKPANVLLDISDHSNRALVVRARYIDFSAAFVPGQDSGANAGGTWDFMAPEQLRIQKDLNTPTFASDIWSLGVTLLYIIVGCSPYLAACGDNLFMLREAIKSGDALGFARMDPVVQKRLAACQDFVDCCRLALQKDRTRRSTAEGWKQWLEGEGMR